MTSVLIRGEGVAASACAHLLGRAGFFCTSESAARTKLPVIMIGQRTQQILADIFERKNLFDDLPRIRKRVVAWGADSAATVLPHEAVIVSERVLLNRIRPQTPLEGTTHGTNADWVLFASRPLPEPAVEHHFGSRSAVASAVKLRPACEAEACWIESVESGWLFLLPMECGRGWLLSVGAPTQTLLSMSKLVAARIAGVDDGQAGFPCSPRVAHPLCKEGWLACGSAALGFDPLCGDGTGNAVREAILASAVIRTAESTNTEALLAHYEMRLMAAFRRHLQMCLEFYQRGRCGPWWDEEIESLRRGLKWCADQLGDAPAFRYRLNGFVLEAM